MTTLTVTAKGQITLKQELLRHMNIAPGQKVVVSPLPGGRIAIGAPAQKSSIKAFSGSLARKGLPKLSIEQINKIASYAWAGKR